MRRVALAVLIAVITPLGLSACGSQDNTVLADASVSDEVRRGSQLFTARCAGCHTLDAVGAQGSSYKIKDRERVDGPNFNVRKECLDNVLYAIENGGYSGAIMPQNIVVGQDAKDVANFLEKYSGLDRKTSSGSTPITCDQK